MTYKLVDIQTNEVLVQSDYAMLLFPAASQYYGLQLIWESSYNKNIIYGCTLNYSEHREITIGDMLCRIEWHR